MGRHTEQLAVVDAGIQQFQQADRSGED